MQLLRHVTVNQASRKTWYSNSGGYVLVESWRNRITELRNYASVLNYGLPENFNAPLYDKFLEALMVRGYQLAYD